MYIQGASIRNIRSIAALEWSPVEKGAGWHVILGDNGSGKSSFLRSLALALIGPREAAAARQDWNAWLRSGKARGFAMVDVVRDAAMDAYSGRGSVGKRKRLNAAVELARMGKSETEVRPSKVRSLLS